MFAPSTKILIVDDMKTMRMFVRKGLGLLGLKNVTEAEDGKIAWAAMDVAEKEMAPYQLIVSDWNMPNMSGIDLLKKVREHPSRKGTPFVLVTAENDKEQVVQAVKLGVNGYITKPFDGPTLEAKLKALYNNLHKKAG